MMSRSFVMVPFAISLATSSQNRIILLASYVSPKFPCNYRIYYLFLLFLIMWYSVCLYVRLDGQTNMMKLIVALEDFRNFANAPKNKHSTRNLQHSRIHHDLIFSTINSTTNFYSFWNKIRWAVNHVITPNYPFEMTNPIIFFSLLLSMHLSWFFKWRMTGLQRISNASCTI
jgi:hypothetical protein